MIPSKIVALCLVGFVLFANYIEARPAPDDESPGKHEHVHHHVHHHHTEGGEPHVHHHKEEGGTHVHHFSTGGSGGGGGSGGADGGGGSDSGSGGGGSGGGSGGAGGDLNLNGGGGSGSAGADLGLNGGGGSGGLGGDLNLGGSGGGGLGNLDLSGLGGDLNLGGSGGGGLGNLDLSNLNLNGFSPDTIKKFKNMLGNLNVDLSQLDLGNLGLGGAGGGAGGSGGGAGGAGGVVGGGIHKYDGKDSLQPQQPVPVCDDSINDRYGVGKHFVRGTRDVGAAIVSEAEDLLDPLLGGLTQGVGQGLKALLCAIENGFSDFGSDFDSATDIAKHGLVNFFKLQGPSPVLGIPVGIAGIAGEAVKAAASIGFDAVGGVESALNQVFSQALK